MGQQAHRTARRRRLGSALRGVREAARVTVAEAAGALHCDNTKISRIETGGHRVTRLELDRLLDLYAVSEEKTREWLIALAAEGRKRSWWHQYGEPLPARFKETLALESDVAAIHTFQAQVIPGLLQTREYAATVMSGSDPLSPQELDFYVGLRMERQGIFRRENAPEYLCILPEGVLRHSIGGPALMAKQLWQLVEVSRAAKVTVQVVPSSQSAFTCTGARADPSSSTPIRSP
ncbi:helix-turn-helix transcriptional regulator [Streptomyces sp. ISL-11]|uniref:helix-turn-helix domain-containing protein n=1 Tax=Streptomyces sp. ISL-11 TaxID=2819174 RepID=UPI001BEC2A74|nr:helix-turn-helix transcriptional regulator [Streptomyces sp. ISL-11]MBT2382661.1 helix-turn-helix domain-containing protein [Streptomyces sp. ISL-11]